MDDRKLSAVFGFEGKNYQLFESVYWPAVMLPDGRLVRFLKWFDSNPVIVNELEVVSIDQLWQQVLESDRYVAKDRTGVPSHWFRFEGVRYESVSRPWPVGVAKDKVLMVWWEDITTLDIEMYTKEQLNDIEKFMPVDLMKSMGGIMSDWYRSSKVEVIPGVGKLITLLPVAELVY